MPNLPADFLDFNSSKRNLELICLHSRLDVIDSVGEMLLDLLRLFRLVKVRQLLVDLFN